MIKTKAKGGRRERQARKFLENFGYAVTRSSGSLGLFDLIAINENQIRLIQVKSNWCPPKEKKAIKRFQAPVETTKEIWIFKDREKIIKRIIC